MILIGKMIDIRQLDGEYTEHTSLLSPVELECLTSPQVDWN